MGISFLAVIAVMVLLIGFTVVVLRSLAISAGIRIRRDMLRLMESYDHVIDAKSREIKELQRSADAVRGELAQLGEPAAPQTAPQSGTDAPLTVQATADYRNTAFGTGYGKIRARFGMSEAERGSVVEQVVSTEEGYEQGRGALAAECLAQFSYDTVFKLVQLPSEDQLEILDSTLPDEYWELLRDYCGERDGQAFDLTLFMSWLKDISALDGDEMYVRSGDRQLCELEGMEYSPQICEGVQISAGRRLYDFSVQKREIS